MRQLHWVVVVGGSIVALAASVACGGGKDGTASPSAVAATPSVAATGTVASTATQAAATATLSTGVAPSATAAPQQPEGAPPLPTAVRATPTSPPPPPPPPPPPSEQSLTIVAKDVKFAPSSLTARAGGVLHLTLDNQDAGVPHDIIVYDPSGAAIAGTDPATGPVQQTLTVTLGAAGRYAFKCSVHPTTMNGVLIVQ